LHSFLFNFYTARWNRPDTTLTIGIVVPVNPHRHSITAVRMVGRGPNNYNFTRDHVSDFHLIFHFHKF